MALITEYKEYKLYASKIPTESEPQPQIFVSTIYAKNSVSARSKLNKILEKQYKIKPCKSAILDIQQITEPNDELVVKNYSISYVHRSKRGLHNMYKEFSALSRADAVSMLYHDMAGRHNAKSELINVVEVKEVSVEEMKRLKVIQYTKEDVRFPVFRKKINTKETFVPQGVKFYD